MKTTIVTYCKIVNSCRIFTSCSVDNIVICYNSKTLRIVEKVNTINEATKSEHLF